MIFAISFMPEKSFVVDSVGTAVHCEKSYFVNQKQSRNAYLPMLVTPLEIIIPTKKWQDSNA